MTRKRVVPGVHARRNIESVVDYYTVQDGLKLALRFIDALESASRYIGAHPGAGAPRWEILLDMPGLRAWRLQGFPYLVFYIERPDAIEVWRVLHAERDLMAELAGDAESED